MTVWREYSWRGAVLKAKGLLGSAPLALGIDWGSRLTKTLTLQSDRNGLTLHDFSLHPVNKQLLQDEPSDTELVEAIQKRVTVPFSIIGTALSGPSVFIKKINLPVMSEEDLRDHLALELDRYIAFDVQDVFWDVYHQESSPEGTINQPEHFLVVAKKECVERQVEAFRQGGVTVRFVDVDIFALINLVTYNYGKKGNWLLAHIGPTGMVMVVIVQGEPAFIRKVAYEAEWYEDLLDQLLQPEISLDATKKIGASETLLLQQFLQETREQIGETVESFSDSSKGGIDRGILLSGGYAVVPEMATTLAFSLGISVQLLDPFQSIIVPLALQQDPVFQQSVPLMGVAVGVALRGVLTHDSN